jgi:hypothetical protein
MDRPEHLLENDPGQVVDSALSSILFLSYFAPFKTKEKRPYLASFSFLDLIRNTFSYPANFTRHFV